MSTCEPIPDDRFRARKMPWRGNEPATERAARRQPKPAPPAEPQPTAMEQAKSGLITLTALGAAGYLAFLDFSANGSILRSLGAAGLVFIGSMLVLNLLGNVLGVVFRALKVAIQVTLLGAAVLFVCNLQGYEWAQATTEWLYGFGETVLAAAKPFWTKYGLG